MSMNTLTILQLIGIVCAYSFLMLAVPAFALWRHLGGMRVIEKLLFCFIAENFYVINLVYFLQLFKLSNRFTLVLGILIPLFFFWKKDHTYSARERAKYAAEQFRRLTGGTLGAKSFWERFFRTISRAGKKNILDRIVRAVKRNKAEAVYLFILTAVVSVIFGSRALTIYGYSASDMIVHNFWINAMDGGTIFTAGVYPYGFHCVVYAVHKLFGFRIFTLMRLFYFVTALFLVYVTYAFVRLLTRNRFVYYGLLVVMVIQTRFYYFGYLRYYASLPQEYGMLFILPVGYYAFVFFRMRSAELADGLPDPDKKKAGRKITAKQKSEEKAAGQTREESIIKERVTNRIKGKTDDLRQRLRLPSALPLLGILMSMSLTFTVHFYDTFIALFFCMAVVIGFAHLFWKKQYLFPVLRTVLLCAVITVLPFAIAIAQGTELQGSLYWGLNVIKGEESGTVQQTGEPDYANLPTTDEEGEVYHFDQAGNLSEVSKEAKKKLLEENGIPLTESLQSLSDSSQADVSSASTAEEKDGSGSGIGQAGQKVAGAVRSLLTKIQDFFETLVNEMRTVFSDKSVTKARIALAAILAACLFGMLSAILHRAVRKQWDFQSSVLLSGALFQLILLLALCPESFHLPLLMDFSRAMIFFAYFLPVLACLLLDAAFSLVGHIPHTGILCRAAALLLSVFMVGETIWSGNVRTLTEPIVLHLESNGAMICLANILRSEEKQHWTVVSANDERQMIHDEGYHYEMIDFLTKMKKLSAEKPVYIPTEDVYFFIEKKPLWYTGDLYPHDLLPQVSEQNAKTSISEKAGYEMYNEDLRPVVMSKMYYWAQSFRKKFPEACTVYYEDDNFICYHLHQNPYRLYNLAIDYGYND
ncbi:MAG: hypothetical protein U0L49_03760 [Eubacterium sp.]|nr:hypothetical protein [Eubacterium sp.]